MFDVIVSSSKPRYGRITSGSIVLLPGSGFRLVAVIGPAKLKPAFRGSTNSGLNAVPGGIALMLKFDRLMLLDIADVRDVEDEVAEQLLLHRHAVVVHGRHVRVVLVTRAESSRLDRLQRST